jgi:hypothetical protein
MIKMKMMYEAQHRTLTGNQYDVGWSTLFEPSCSLTKPHSISKAGLSDLVRELNWSKYQSEILDSRFKVWNLLDKCSVASLFLKCEKYLLSSCPQEGNLVHNVNSVIETLGQLH